MTLSIVKDNLLRLKQEIVPYTPRIIAVTKYYGPEAILSAYDAGLRDFGESKANEAILKISSLPLKIRNNSTFHFIGHLQTNKVDRVVKNFDYIQSVDSYKLANRISECAQSAEKVQNVLLQVNISGETQKFGFKVEELRLIFNELTKLKGISINGLMCMAPLGATEEELTEVFSNAKSLLEEFNRKYSVGMRELSMGMSDDYKCAVANGATMIRVGRILFN